MSLNRFRVLLIVLFALPSLGATLDQSFLPTGPTGGSGSIYIGIAQSSTSAQIYTAGLNGTLAGVTLDVYSSTAFVSFDYPLEVQILAVTGGSPNGTILGDTTLARSYTDLSSLITFSQTIPQVAGTQYGITEFYPSAPTFSNAYGGFGALIGAFTVPGFAPEPYPAGYITFSDGTTWSNYGDTYRDEYFSTYVDTSVQPTPEPGSLWLVGIAGLGLACVLLAAVRRTEARRTCLEIQKVHQVALALTI